MGSHLVNLRPPALAAFEGLKLMCAKSAAVAATSLARTNSPAVVKLTALTRWSCWPAVRLTSYLGAKT